MMIHPVRFCSLAAASRGPRQKQQRDGIAFVSAHSRKKERKNHRSDIDVSSSIHNGGG